ncbi:unnamed protein product [Phaedon cochleariae]|uniref:Major facilitator superfamily (MFS) profile domain-containing protein n=1 Tax=Phaedon cochleariae TaxID=80249 RepID=A0A9N9SDZ1_PHACE|nr:unnamed protein product [Phaedon cochleariae]
MEPPGECENLFDGSAEGYKRGSIRQSPYTDISVERPGWSKLLILAGVSTTVGLSVPVGYNIGVVNTPAEIIKSFCNETVRTRFDTQLSENGLELMWSFIVSVFLVGAAVGSLGGSVLADKIGRKGVVILCTILAAIGAVAFWTTKAINSIELLLAGRILVGLSAGLTTSVVPMYLTELAPLHLRGATGVLCPLGVTIGVLFGQIISLQSVLGTEAFWPHCLAAFVLPVSVSALTLPFLPESPKYLFVIRKQPHVALKQLQKIRDMKEEFLVGEIEDLKLEQQDNELNAGHTWNVLKVLSDKSLLLPLVLVCSLQAGQQLSGINAVFYYSNKIFKEAGLSKSENELATIGTGICNMSMAVLSIFVMSKFNRRICIQISLLTSAFFLILLGIAIIYIKSYSWVPYLSIVGVLGFVLCYGLGLGPIPYFVGSELFEVGPRPSAMALGSMSNWGANFVVGLTFPLMQSTIGASSFFIFAGLVLVLFVLLRFYLPETRGRDVIEIVELCRDGFASKPLRHRENTLQNIDEAKKLDALQNV